MAFTVDSPKGAEATKAWREHTGLESGSGVVVRFSDWANECVVEYIPTSPGTASLKFSLDEATPTDDTGFTKTNIGDVTAAGAQVVSKAAHLAFVPASGTWTARFLFKRA